MDDLPVDHTAPAAPRLAAAPSDELPAGFVPLCLLLQPGGLSVNMNKPEMIVGRHSEADVRLSLPDISRRHCRFVFSDGVWQIYDLNSLNGVFVNGERLNEATLHKGDRIRIGSLTFEVEVEGNVPQPVIHRAVETHCEEPSQVRRAS